MSGSVTALNIATDTPATFAAYLELVPKQDPAGEEVALVDLNLEAGAKLFNFYDDAFTQINEVFNGTRTATAIAVSGNATVGGTLGVTGNATLNGNVYATATVSCTAASALLHLGDGTGSPRILASKSDAGDYAWMELRSGGTGSANRRWYGRVAPTTQSFELRNYDVSGVLVGTPLTINWSTGATTLLATTVSSLTSTGNATVGGTLTSTGAATIGGNLRFNGTSLTAGGTSIQWTVNGTHSYAMTDTYFVPVPHTTTSLGLTSNRWGSVNAVSLNLSGNASVGGTLTVTGATTLSSLTVSGAPTFSQAILASASTAIVLGSTSLTDPVIMKGTGVPAVAAANGSFFLRTDGAAGSTAYIRAGGAWHALS